MGGEKILLDLSNFTILILDEIRSDYYCGITGLGFRDGTAMQPAASRVMTRNTGTVSLWFVTDTR